ncbi:TRAP transporter substrate-binding protein DctP [Oligoflexus tunisiensis]|uniref:TRAP transporter substrate-binding protein DctP n=1 Tax=Oligoflexus tunisiensis TaxID=708132 RepID=UPI00114D0391|nr:TRAP transporter substrate-binding protein DctP [Oligoflexus tunisiensis]
MRLPSLMTKFGVSVAALLMTTTLSAKNIKFGIVTPKGSTWTNIVEEMEADLKKQTGGKLDLKIMDGGKKGDEIDMLRAMERNTLQAAAFTGVGLENLVKSIRILEAPLLFKTNEEIDKVKEVLFDDFAKEFDKKGYVLLGFAEAGFVNVFSKQKIDNEASLKNIKMWVWTGDTVASRFLEEFGIRATPLTLTDVTMGLDKGMIDSFYSPPLAAVAFQWFSKVKYMLDYPFVNSTGAFIMKKETFNALPADQQKILRDTAKVYCKKVVDVSRKENEEAKGLLKANGIQFLKPSEADIKKYHSYAENVYKKSIGDTYSKELFDKVQGILKGMRK